MNNMDIYANYYIKNPDFKQRFDERLQEGKIRGWTKEGQLNLEKLKKKFKEFKDPDTQQAYSDLFDKLSILNIQKHPL